MSPTLILEAFTALVKLIDRFMQGDKVAAKRLKDILPATTFTRMVREREKARDRAKFGG
jgi:hypothetical protein